MSQENVRTVHRFLRALDRRDYENARRTQSGDLVVIGLRSRGHGATSGVPIDVRWGLRASMRDGKIERIDISGDYTSALEAAGLSE